MKKDDITKGTILEDMNVEDSLKIIENMPDLEFEPVIDTGHELGVLQDVVETPVTAIDATTSLTILSNTQDDQNMEDDFELARSNLKELAEMGKDVIEDLILLAKQSDQPRAYEVLANTFNTMAALNKDLLEIRNKKSEIKRKNSVIPVTHIAAPGTTNIQQNMFFGSTSELQKLIKQNQNINPDGE